jgi:hypothetical protein
MKSAKSLLNIMLGAVGGMIIVISCSDHSPTPADAASCDCPTSEAPIPGRIVEIVNPSTLPPANVAPANGRAGGGAICPAGSILISGGCSANAGQVPDIVLEQSFPNGDTNTWICDWRNNTNVEVPVRGVARCLVPAR